MDASTPLFFLGAALELAAVDLLLGADNAILIALACRTLPPALRPRALAYAVGGAIALRFLLAGIAGLLMKIPLVKLVGGAVLIAIAVELLAHTPKPDRATFAEAEASPFYGDRFWRAVGAVVAADALMSLDNVLALASIAQGNLPLLALGIAFAIPALAFGSYFVGQGLDRWPWLVGFGAALLGWVAGQMAVSDAFWDAFIKQHAPLLGYAAPALCAAFVLVWGRFGPRRMAPAESRRGVIPTKAKKAIALLSVAPPRKRRVLLATIALIAAAGILLLTISTLRG